MKSFSSAKRAKSSECETAAASAKKVKAEPKISELTADNTEAGNKKTRQQAIQKQVKQKRSKSATAFTVENKRTDPTRIKQFNQQQNNDSTEAGNKRTRLAMQKQVKQKRSKSAAAFTTEKKHTDPTRIKQFNQQQNNGSLSADSTEAGNKRTRQQAIQKQVKQKRSKSAAAFTTEKKRTDPTRIKQFNQQKNSADSTETGNKRTRQQTIQKQMKQKRSKSAAALTTENKRTDPTRIKQFNQQKNSGHANWRELKERKKSLKQMRKQKKFAVIDTISQAKKLYEISKNNKLPKKQREEIGSRLYNLLKGHLKAIVYKHDMTRITQLLMKVSPENTRHAIWSELKPELLKMMTSKYAAHTVISILEFGGTSVRKEVAGLLKGHVLELLKNKVASMVIDKIYKTYSVPEDRDWMRKELSGFKDDKTVSKFLEIIEGQGCFCPESPESKLLQSLVECVKQEEESSATVSTKVTLQMLIEKDLALNALVQSVLSDYLMKCNSTDRKELISTLQPTLERILDAGLDTFNAVMLLIQYVWFGSSKERKWVTKQLHSKMPGIGLQNYSYLLVMIVLECMDDTVLLKKTLVKDVLKDVREFVDSNYGWKIIMHILAPRSPRHFSSSYLSLLKMGDSIAVKKKSDEVRHAELLEPFINPLLEDINTDLSYWISDGRRTVLCYEAICVSKGTELEKALKNIVHFVCKEKPGVLVDRGPEFSSQLEWLLKQLIKSDKQRLQENEITFSGFFLSAVAQEDIKSWVEGRAGIVIFLKLIDTEIPSVRRSVKKLFTPDIKAAIDNTTAGDTLRNKLKQI
ncbi:pumilio homolog 3-like isoform X3 [Schistocerca serialis cubense]|uniref:pumilio homolog 3-like isoform X3 n=1 Tax=Schistocerca serialis cubense TaxID=2023355 RepID=UPI00214E798A|nr:pumilio homolog 3-like isoform X3 [Schistocerca serialis cubense]